MPDVGAGWQSLSPSNIDRQADATAPKPNHARSPWAVNRLETPHRAGALMDGADRVGGFGFVYWERAFSVLDKEIMRGRV